MANFIPEFISERSKSGEMSGYFRAYSSFIDISGFTQMTQVLMNHGKEGAEVLSDIINQVFSPSIEIIYQHGGFVSSFAGDAFTAIFQIEAAEYALNAAFEIIKFFKHFGLIHTRFGEFQLEVKIGLSYGQVEYGIIHTEVSKTFFFRGEGIENCTESEHYAERMEIVADTCFINQLNSSIEKQEIRGKYYQMIPSRLEITPFRIVQSQKYDSIEKEYILPSILNLKEAGEFREIVSVFIRFQATDQYLNAIKQLIMNCHIYGGYFNKIDFGDKGSIALVIFGAPTGKEKLYQRAIEFALSLQQIEHFQYRIGISSGIAFTGLVGSSLRREYTALGNVVNLSARMMMKADWKQILSDQQFVRNLSKLYQFHPLGWHQFKGFSYKVELFRFHEKNINKVTMTFNGTFVGRSKEIKLLEKMMIPLKKHKFGGMLYIDGEAGIGKSRFIDHFSQTNQDINFLYLPCDEILKKSFYPFEYFFKRYFEQSDLVSKEQNEHIFLYKYEQFISQVPDEVFKNELNRNRAIISALIGVQHDQYYYNSLDAKARYENTLYAIKSFFKAYSIIKPLALIIDDANWIDIESLTLINVLINNIENYPIIIIALCRPKDDGSHFHIIHEEVAEIKNKRLKLTAFNKETMRELLSDKLQCENIPDTTIGFIWDKSNGNPFFIEQLLFYLIENDLFDKEFKLKKGVKDIPAGISQIIITRIDRLSDKLKEMVKTASVLGREFMLRVLERMVFSQKITDNENDFEEQLVHGSKEQIWEHINELSYMFKHALIRDAIYEIQLKENLRRLHQLAGNIIEELYSSHLEYHYEELSEHFEKAENREKSIEYLNFAANYAKSNYQNLKAIDYFLHLQKYLKEDEDAQLLTEVLLNQGIVLELIGKWDEALSCYEKATKISSNSNHPENKIDSMNHLALIMKNKGRIDESLELLTSSLKLSESIYYQKGIRDTLGYLGIVHADRGEYDQAMELYYRKLKLCEEANDKKGISEAIGNIGIIHVQQGNYIQAMECYEQDIGICKALGDKRSVSMTICNMGLVYSSLGNYPKAMECFHELLNISEELGDKKSMSAALGNIGIVYADQGHIAKAMEYYHKKLLICEELGDKKGISSSVGNMGLIYSNQGNYEKAMECFLKQKSLCESIGDQRGVYVAESNMGLVYYNQLNYSKAMHSFTQVMKICEESGDKRGYSSALCNIGNIYLDQNQYDLAMQYYQKNLEIKEELGEKRGISIALCNIGLAYVGLGDYIKAMECYEQNLAISEALEDLSGISMAVCNIGLLYYEKGEFDQAISYYLRDLEICKESDDQSGISMALGNLAAAYYETGDSDLSLKTYHQALELANELNIKPYICRYMFNQALIYMEKGKFDLAETLNRQVYEMSEALGLEDINFNSEELSFVLKGDLQGLLKLLHQEKISEEKKANLYYDLWKISKNEAFKHEAKQCYQALYLRIPKYQYRKRMQELNH